MLLCMLVVSVTSPNFTPLHLSAPLSAGIQLIRESARRGDRGGVRVVCSGVEEEDSGLFVFDHLDLGVAECDWHRGMRQGWLSRGRD